MSPSEASEWSIVLAILLLGIDYSMPVTLIILEETCLVGDPASVLSSKEYMNWALPKGAQARSCVLSLRRREKEKYLFRGPSSDP